MRREVLDDELARREVELALVEASLDQLVEGDVGRVGARVLGCGECDVAGEEDGGIEQDELRGTSFGARAAISKASLPPKECPIRTDSRAPTVSTIASTCAPMSHGGSQGELPWPRRSGARTW